MAKIIKYQLATEHPYEVVVEVPVLDEDGNQLMEEVVTPVTEEVIVPVLDENGEPSYDENGDPVTETINIPVYDENGYPVTETTYKPVFTTETRQEIELAFNDVAIKCATEASFQANLPIAEREAYNGEYMVEDDGVPEPIPEESTDDILDALLGVTE